MVATSLSVAAWLTMVLLAVGKLDGRSKARDSNRPPLIGS